MLNLKNKLFPTKNQDSKSPSNTFRTLLDSRSNRVISTKNMKWTLKDDEGKHNTEPEDIARAFNEYFTNLLLVIRQMKFGKILQHQQ